MTTSSSFRALQGQRVRFICFFIYFTYFGFAFKRRSLFVYTLILFLFALLFPSFIWRSTVDSKSFACPRGNVFPS